MNIDVNGTLWVDVEEVEKVNRVIVTEPKSKFCKVFYTDPIPETRFAPSEEYVKPKASAQPMRKKGRWIDTGSMEEWWAKEFKCSECGESMLGTANYCHNCGAEMRGEANVSKPD